MCLTVPGGPHMTLHGLMKRIMMSRHRGQELRQGPKTGLLASAGPPIDLSTVMAQGRLFGLRRWRTRVELHSAGLGTLQEHTHKCIQATWLVGTQTHGSSMSDSPFCIWEEKTKMSVRH